ncbi:hypothetical protein [Agrobacterium sp. NPDC090283]|uniref:hypothetical protein n=1 Tax=Agrobacterium sp. NPDC090283 TaxID=3363920 RepID=UPI00383A75A7
MDEAERLSRGNGRYLDASRVLEAFESLKACFRTRIDHARRFPEPTRGVFDDLDFELRVRYGIGDARERAEIMRRFGN